MTNLLHLFSSVRQAEKQLRSEALHFVMGNIANEPIRNTGHFREWFRVPMNYVRIMELPLTLLLLQAERHEAILDVSSPKLLALYYALRGYSRVVAADLEDYFVGDFETYREHAGLAIDTATFDVSERIPYPSEHFDKVFSISVLEHIPFDGDTRAVKEMLRVLKTTGHLVITLPVFPNYVEEWLSWPPPWRSLQNEEGKSFFQRRYDLDTLLKRLSVPGGIIEEMILIAEKPVKPPRMGEDGMMLHNAYYIDNVRTAHFIKRLGIHLKFIPFTGYLAELFVSKKCHYLTTDWTDPNIRQVVVKMSKRPASEQGEVVTI